MSKNRNKENDIISMNTEKDGLAFRKHDTADEEESSANRIITISSEDESNPSWWRTPTNNYTFSSLSDFSSGSENNLSFEPEINSSSMSFYTEHEYSYDTIEFSSEFNEIGLSYLNMPFTSSTNGNLLNLSFANDLEENEHSLNYVDSTTLVSDDYLLNGIPSGTSFNPISESDSEVQVIREQSQFSHRNREENDVVVIESIDRSRLFPRVNLNLVLSIAKKLFISYRIKAFQKDFFNIYSLPLEMPSLAETLRSFSSNELRYLCDKVSCALIHLISDTRVINYLVSFITPDKIDTIDSMILPSFKRDAFKSSKFKDLLNVESKECPICFDAFKPESKCITLNCCHIFHSGCINKWVLISFCCPVCRSKDIA